MTYLELRNCLKYFDQRQNKTYKDSEDVFHLIPCDFHLPIHYHQW